MIHFSHCLVQRCQQEGYLKEQASNEVVQVVQRLWCQISHALSCNQALLILMQVDVMQYWRATFQSKIKNSNSLRLLRRSLSCNYFCRSKNTLEFFDNAQGTSCNACLASGSHLQFRRTLTKPRTSIWMHFVAKEEWGLALLLRNFFIEIFFQTYFCHIL